MTARAIEKKHLSLKGLLRCMGARFAKVADPIKGKQGPDKKISLRDCLMSGLAIFGLKYPSLHKFDNEKDESRKNHNLKGLYNIERAPCDTYLRERLDEVEPRELRDSFTDVFAALQRGKALEKYQFLNGKYLLLCDGTGYFSSRSVHCENCCTKKHKDGSVSYYHQALGAAIVHPNYREVIPVCPEPIVNSDGATKNDCERNASVRLLKDFRREHPHLAVIVVEDALSSNGPHIRLLQELNISHITVVKPEGNKSLFEWLQGVERETHEFIDEKGQTHKFSFVSEIPLNDTHPDLLVNFLEYHIFDKKQGNQQGKQIYHNTWITDLVIANENVFQIAQGGRARWKIENETFNTLKNQGYHFEHNFGHGNKNLSTVFMMLMMLAFLIDQVQQMCCGLFQAAWEKLKTKANLWETVRNLFKFFYIDSWEDVYQAIIQECYGGSLTPDTS